MEQKQTFVLAAVIALVLVLFITDVVVPLGVTVWVPYVGAVLLALWLPQARYVYITAAVCSILTLVAWVASPPGEHSFWISFVNRLQGIMAFWATAYVGLAVRRTLELQKAHTALQEEMERRQKLEAQLLRSQRLESVGVLAGGIAHDFNNLLTPMLMAIKLLKEPRPEEDRLHLLGTLQASAERGADTIRQLLSFAGGSDGQRMLLSLQRVIKEVKSILDHTFPRNIVLQLNLAADLCQVFADATQLSQVLVNLCVNARDAMPAGGTLMLAADNVTLGTDAEQIHVAAKPGSYVRTAVTDTGTGIPPAVLDRVFDPFFSTKGQGKGSGLGLSTALGIVKAHGGFITVQSEINQGTRFNVYLPSAVEDAPPTVSPDRPKLPSGHGELILVVDDEPFILETVQTTLERHGYQVLTALDGLEALARYRERRGDIHAVLLDLMMPNMDGTATLATLEEHGTQVPIIATSGVHPTGRLAQAVAEGKYRFLPKPYTDEQLLLALASVLHKP